MASQGTFVQLACKGPFEEKTLGPAQNSFKQRYRRPTRFAVEEKAHVFPNNFYFGSTNNTLDISRDGDLLGSITLQIHLPAFPDASPTDKWVDSVGYVLLRRVVLQIDDTIVQDQERLWYDLADTLFVKAEHRRGLDAMIGRNATLPLLQAHTLYVPLKLLCCKDHRTEQNWLPLINIPSSTIRLTIHSESLANCIHGNTYTPPPNYNDPLDVRALTQYATVEAPERERMILRPTAVLYESVQDMESLSYKISRGLRSGSDARVPLDIIKVDMSELNSPVKLLVWVSYTTSYQTYFAYTDDIEDSIVLINGNERFSRQKNGYFTLWERYARTDAVSAPSNVHIYSFALNAAPWHPSGTLNFDQVPSPTLEVRLKAPRTDLTVKVFAVCYKRLIFGQGRAALEFI